MSATLNNLLNFALARDLIDLSEIQIWKVDRFLQPPVMSSDARVLPWVEQQGLGQYQPPRLPYPLVTQTPALIWGEAATVDWSALSALLAGRYPLQHPLTLIALPAETVQSLTLADLATVNLSATTSFALLMPALALPDDRHNIDRLRWVISRLLGPDGCPWDVRQTHQSLRGALLEEVYEVLEALDTGTMAQLCEELGDVLMHVIMHSEMARQAGHFSLEDVARRAADKLVFRHPHVFGAADVTDVGQVIQNWEELKARELAAKGQSRASVLDGVPAALPALAAAQTLASKAIQAGFTWTTIEYAWAKVDEELAELRAAPDSAAQMAELGDLLFAITTLAHWLQLDAEAALREANARYKRRLQLVEQMAARSGRSLRDCSLTELITWWAEAKAVSNG
ncbi:nucleoside triphosphate pyrophosphohydrolase [Chloroflexus sp.]|uniref:nucleoside triphosphate pyrophosphohydrolase n=1 Tax=Chloroflexus sp. TaxID=1904827 RepID=UPI0026107D8D|nr:nucleoside triphosphate pyrophosphohydrolase [uncultured Chloroflexus sp.]